MRYDVRPLLIPFLRAMLDRFTADFKETEQINQSETFNYKQPIKPYYICNKSLEEGTYGLLST